jgi:hypothetical protein
MPVLAPMPSASVTMATMVNPLAALRRRIANRMSFHMFGNTDEKKNGFVRIYL